MQFSLEYVGVFWNFHCGIHEVSKSVKAIFVNKASFEGDVCMSVCNRIRMSCNGVLGDW